MEGQSFWCPFQSKIGASQSLANMNMLFSHVFFLRSWFDILVS